MTAPDGAKLTDSAIVAELEDAGLGLGEFAMGVNTYDDELGWPPRPEGATSVMWIGPEAPGIGGSGANAATDMWVPTIEDT